MALAGEEEQRRKRRNFVGKTGRKNGEGKGGKYLICREEEQWRRRNLFGEGKLMVTPMYICWAEKGTRALKSLKLGIET